MYVIAVKGKEEEGAFSVVSDNGEKMLYIFAEKDDVERYVGLLEAEDKYPPLAIVEVEDQIVDFCEMSELKYFIVTNEDIVIPQHDYF